VPYPVKKLSKKVETCLTFYNAGYSIIFYIQSVCLFRKCNELFVRSCLREGKVDLDRKVSRLYGEFAKTFRCHYRCRLDVIEEYTYHRFFAVLAMFWFFRLIRFGIEK